MKFCTQCGEQLNDKARFCTKCGAVVGASGTQAVRAGDAPYKNYAAARSKNIKIAVIAVVVVVIVAALTGGYFLLFGSSDGKMSFVGDVTSDMWSVLPRIDYTDIDDLEYHVNYAIGGIVVEGYTGSSDKVRIPEKIEDNPVISVDMSGCELTELIVPDTTKTINYNPDTVKYINIPRDYSSRRVEVNINLFGETEFNGKALEAIYISPDCEELSGMTNCDKLTSVHIPKGVVTIKGAAFANCISLKDITIPENVTTIESGAFANCKSLKKVVIPSKVTAIERSTFANCTSLKEITIPDSVEVIDVYAFVNCTSLREIQLPDNIKWCEAEMAFGECKDIVIFYRGKIYTYDILNRLSSDIYYNNPDYRYRY